MPLKLSDKPRQTVLPLQENTALRDELTTSKSTILHLIHELNQAKNQAARSDSGSQGQQHTHSCVCIVTHCCMAQVAWHCNTRCKLSLPEMLVLA